ncbi:asparagine synthase (glutamine-hydrolyzing) [Rhodanobacter sp. DHB23]|uniref:asparagine synthase (glutamine-hydrolyzing) n=1 Tax=Rhodanobacter sp. DHB23 TaxID=2775923 RepID=UPI00177E328C|nr:asparagine synthase (glutamine-hydrolyzing) [Rhodanobacter sp. DHB23]
MAGTVRSSSVNNEIGEDFLRRFIARRGPDSSREISHALNGHKVTLIHTRLSIIDLDGRSGQPMEDCDSGWAIVYNGEIYNYLELRQELATLGYNFDTKGDTEVLLKAWAHWGVEMLAKLNGMFAFGAFNRRTGELWLVRDRFGVKPLLWGRLPCGGLVFSSSAAGIAASVGDEVDVGYCARGLRYKAFELPESGAPFRKVNSVPPGAWVKVSISDAGLGITEKHWYNLNEAVFNRAAALAMCSDEQAMNECQQTLESAVQLRLRSDVPLAVSLSGGLDSSSIAALASRHVSCLSGFTYGSPTAKSSEGPVVANFARQVGISAEFVWPKHGIDSLDASLEHLLTAQEAPFSGLSVLAQNEVFRAVRSAGFKVLLGGQGGDESFGGYRKFFVVALRDALSQRDPRGAMHFAWSLGLMLLHEARQAKMYWQSLSRYRSRGAFAFQLLDWEPEVINLWGDQGSSLRARQIEDVQRWSIPSLLRYEDRNSMWHGVETRLPFMDYRLVELALALPSRLKIAKGFGKWALRKIDKGVVPDFIRLNRRKRGFDVTQSWLNDGIGVSLRKRILEHRGVLASHLKAGVDLERRLTTERLSDDRNLLDEALMLAWLVKPVRMPPPVEVTA